MIEARFNRQLFNTLWELLLRLHYGESTETIKGDLQHHLADIPIAEVLLIVHEINNNDDGITSEDIEKLFSLYTELSGHSVQDLYMSKALQPGHPVQIFQAENKQLALSLEQLSELIGDFEKNEQTSTLENIKMHMEQMGQFFNHFHRKEKLFFPILERYGHFTLTRIMWTDDDQIRNLYKGTKSMLDKLPNVSFKYIKKTYHLFERKLKQMIFEEEIFLLPVVCSFFTEDDWVAIAQESDAFGFTLIEPDEKWVNERTAVERKATGASDVETKETEQILFGGGYLTLKEANHILNNLPVEITFVDKYGVFKYFNDKVKSSEMMFVRTPSSIGRNVGNCHPPKSVKKVVQLISD